MQEDVIRNSMGFMHPSDNCVQFFHPLPEVARTLSLVSKTIIDGRRYCDKNLNVTDCWMYNLIIHEDRLAVFVVHTRKLDGNYPRALLDPVASVESEGTVRDCAR